MMEYKVNMWICTRVLKVHMRKLFTFPASAGISPAKVMKQLLLNVQ